MVKERKDKKAGAKKTKTDFPCQEEDATSSPMPPPATPTSKSSLLTPTSESSLPTPTYESSFPAYVPAAGSSPTLLLGDKELEMLEVCPPSDYIPGQGS